MAKSPTRDDRTPSPSVATLPPSEAETSKSKSPAAAEPLKGSAKLSDAAAAGKGVKELEDAAQCDDERHRRIAERAYYRAQRRGFKPGGEEEDWLEAEKEVDRGDAA